MDFGVFEESRNDQSAPSMLPGTNATAWNRNEWRHRTARFEMGGQDTIDEGASYDALMDRVIAGDVVIRAEKDSISATTGVYTCVVKYMERIPQGVQNDIS